ncbi:HEAT repeat domain-containing protein [Paracidobacterium acidisoli]|uniref:HEAT repeat domain-containing protein n=1 Tax=Paracidobacterium acidisoli TaxID=2303751 RepID=A0A372IMA2_9BACT|nr:HEAT repeat domain-containing protein [Paracidobacterium acidisoli]MBT9331691.1 HEAT repeat domain-containing protein [Paracidobacterium acidisoli]
MNRFRSLSLTVCLVLLPAAAWPLAFSAQTQQPQPADKSSQAKPAATDEEGEADEPVATPPEELKRQPAEARAAAWKMLETGIDSPKPQPRIDALNALGTLGADRQAEHFITAAMQDKDVDVRIAAVAAMAATLNRRMIPQLRTALDDPRPEVEFAAAVTLWKMHDHTGIDLLYGVLTGERKAHSGFVTSELHEANKDMHSPSTLAEIGAEQGAYALLGPFGIGLDVARMMRKSSNGNSARVLTASLLSENHSATTERNFLDALRDKDYFVRLASARALGKFHSRQTSDALIDTFGDRKPSVRDMAAASYLLSAGPGKHPAAHPVHPAPAASVAKGK